MRHTGVVGFIRGAVVRRLGAIAIVAAACVTGCGAKDLVSVNQPMPSETLFTFLLRDISDLDYEVPEGGVSNGGMQFMVSNSMFGSLLLWTRCGTANAMRLELTGDRFVVNGFDTRFESGKCTPEQFAAAERVGAVIASGPRYRFNGERLQLINGITTVTFALLKTQPLVNGSTGWPSAVVSSR